MTLTEFLAALEQTPRVWWFIDNRGRIRAELEVFTCCPITAIEPHHWSASVFPSAATRLGLGHWLARRIANAADNEWFSDVGGEELRADLLRACGLPA